MKKIILGLLSLISITASAEWQADNRPGLVFGIRGTQMIPKHDKKVVALTFDDGPGAGTAKILDILKKYEDLYGIRIKATFFSLGSAAENNPQLLKRIAREGHIVANHTYDHCDLSNTLAPGKKSNLCDTNQSLVYKDHAEFVLDQIRHTHKIIKDLVPNGHFYFRAPHGFFLKENADLLNQDPELKNYIGPINWTLGGEVLPNPETLKIKVDGTHPYPAEVVLKGAADWQCWSKGYNFSAERCLSGYLAELEQYTGGVVLMHDIYAKTAELVDLMIPELIEQDYSFVTIDELPYIEELRHKGR